MFMAGYGWAILLSPWRSPAANSPLRICTEQNSMKISTGLIISSCLVFKMKKFLDDCLDLPWLQRSGKKWSWWNEQQILRILADKGRLGEYFNIYVYQKLLRQREVPWSRGCTSIMTKNMSLSWFSAGPYPARTTQWLLVELWTPADWVSYATDLNSLDFAIWRILQAKVQAMLHANRDIRDLSIAVKLDRLVVEYISRTFHSFHPCWQAVADKN